MKTLLSLLLAALAITAFAAEPVYLELTLNGEDIEGETTRNTIGGIDVSQMIECLAFTHEVFTTRDAASGLPTGRRQHKPIRITKVIDKATPLLFEGIFQNKPGEAVFRFFRATPGGDGTSQHYMTITLQGAHISAVRTWQPNNLEPGAAQMPALEEVVIDYTDIEIVHEPNGATATDSVEGNRS